MQAFLKRSKAYIWLWLPIVTTIVVVCFFPLAYLTEDDTMNNNIVADVSVQGSEVFSYFRVVFGWSLRLLYLCCPGLNWYAIVLFGCLTGAFCIFMLLMNRAAKKSGKEQNLLYAACMGILFIMQVHNLFHMAFTNVAFFTTLSGGLLFLSQEAPCGKKNIGISIFSLLWFAYGISIRWYSGITAIAFLLVFAVFRWVQTKAKFPILFLAFTLLVVCGFKYLSNYYVPQDETNQLYKYYRFDKSRIATIDKDDLYYEDYKEQFEAANISEEDLALYFLWCYADYNVFHPESFGKVVLQSTKEKSIDFSDIMTAITSMFTSVLNVAYMGLLFVIFLLGEKKNKFWLFIFCGCAEGMIFMLLLRGRLLWRLQLAVMQLGIIPVLLVLLLGANYIPSAIFPFKKKPWLQGVCIGIVCVAAFGLMAARNISTVEMQREKVESYAPIINYVKAQSESGKRFVSLAEHRVHFYYPEISFIQKREKPYFVNIGEADTFHPHWVKTLEECGFSEYTDSIFRALIEGEEVYAFTDQQWNFDDVAGFLRRHYDENIKWVLEEQIGDWYIGSFQSIENQKE